jgi:uncharacterized protein
MQIDVSDIIKINDATLDVDYKGVLEDFTSLSDGYIFDKPVSFNGVVTNAGGVLKLDGRLKASYTTKCYRCLKDIDRELRLRIKEDFLPPQANNDYEFYTYEGNAIDIDKVLKDNIILNLPMKQVCVDNCKGLCRTCGADLNIGQCDCKQEDDVDPRMEALKNFFNN